MGEVDRQRHQLRGLAAGEAEHQPLVAGAAGVDALGDVGGLPVSFQQDLTAVPVKLDIRAVVADLADDLAGYALEIDLGVGGDLARQDDQVRRHQGLAGHPPGGVLAQHLVQDGVGDLVGHLVRVTFRHRLRREQVGFVFAHRHTSGLKIGKAWIVRLGAERGRGTQGIPDVDRPSMLAHTPERCGGGPQARLRRAFGPHRMGRLSSTP